jgi:hypothetical protein
VKRRVHSHRYAGQEREQRGNEGELHRRRKTLADERDHGLLELIGNAEIEMERVPDEARELNDDRIVEPQGFTQLRALGDTGVEPHHLVDRIADEAEQGERDERHHQHDQHGLQRTADEKRKHSPTLIAG